MVKQEIADAVTFIDELEQAVTLTQKWIESEDYLPFDVYTGKQLQNGNVKVGPKTRAVFEAIKKAAS